MKNTIIFGVISLIVWGFSLVVLEEVTEDMISSLIEAGTLDEKYLEAEGWGFDYSTIYGFLISTISFIVLYYGFHMVGKKIELKLKKIISILLIILYIVSIVVLTVLFPQGASFLIPGMIIIACAVIHILLNLKVQPQN